MRYSIRIIILAVFLFLYSCGSSKFDASKKNTPGYKLTAQKIYKNDYRFLFNQDSSYVICLKEFKPTSKYPANALSYFIYNINDSKKIFEDSIHGGSVNWLNKNVVKIKRILEVARKGKGNIIIKYYNVITKEFVPVSTLKLENQN